MVYLHFVCILMQRDGGGRHVAFIWSTSVFEGKSHDEGDEGSSLRAAAHADFSHSPWRGWARATALQRGDAAAELWGWGLLPPPAPGTVSPGLAQAPALSCPTEVLRSWVCFSCMQYCFLFKWPAFEFQCISTCSFLLNHDEEGRGTGKLCSGYLCLLCHMFILF